MKTKNRRGRCLHRPATRIVSLILSLAMLFSITVGIDLSAYATSRTQSEAVNWANSQKGKSLDYDGDYGAQCVDLIYYYYQYLGVSPQGGDASAYINNSLPSGWTRVYGNYQPGDIAVWKGNHVGIIVSSDSVGFNAINQNYNGASYCTQNWFYCSALACAIRPNWSAGNNPIGVLDIVQGSVGEVRVRGWAFDMDQPTTSIGIHVYIGGEAGKGEGHSGGLANSYREDVGKTYPGVGNYHGYDFKVSTNKRGNQTVYVYALNVGNGTNVLIGKKNVTISEPHTHSWNSGVVTKPPTCYSTGVKTYTCTCGVTKTETIPKISHDYSWKNSGGYIVNSCNNCGNEKIRLPFEDLYGYEYYGDYIAYTSVYNKFITGTNPPERTLFSPTMPITRAMFVTILYRMAGEPYKNGTPYRTSPFTDITDTSVYYYDAACWALKNGITTETTFKPFENVNREQTASFLFRYAQKNGRLGNSAYKNVNLATYPDYSDVHGWAVDAMKWANFNGMITGTQQGYINPQGATQRIHATKILHGFGKVCNIGNFA